MVQRTEVVLVDDVDGGDAAETVTFSLDGVSYEIDLNDENAAALRESVSRWVGSARKVSGGRASSSGKRGGRASSGRSSASGNDANAIREWARANGHTVSDRGRISAQVVEAYNAR